MPRLLIKSSNTACRLTLIVIFSLATAAQSGQEHFSQEGVSFNFPAGWVMNDRSRAEAQHLILTHPEISSLIMVVALREPILTRAQLFSATNQITEPYLRDLITRFGNAKSPAKRDSSCEKIDEATIGGVQVRGEMNGAPATAEVYAFPQGRRFLNLVYIRKNAEDSESSAAWKLVRESLKVDVVDSSKVADPEIDLPAGSIYAGGVLNGKALSLPPADYPAWAVKDGAQGPVIVIVTLDETGKVIAAHAASGPIALRSASEQAARKAQFSPTTLCGKPVKVNGSIIYNFVRQ